MKSIKIFATSLLVVWLCSCDILSGLHNDITNATADITAQANKLNGNFANIVDILGAIKNDYGEQVRSIIANDVNRLIKTTIQASSEEMRCDAQFFATYTRIGLLNTVIKLKNLERKEKPEPLISIDPTFCTCTPTYLDLNERDKLKTLDISGYELGRLAELKIFKTSIKGARDEVVHKLSQPPEFHAVLPLSNWKEYQGYDNIEFHYKDALRYAVPIIPITPKVCQEEAPTVAPSPTTYDFMAYHTGGDTEFGGKTHVRCSGNLSISSDGRVIVCVLTFTADENDGDTHAAFQKTLHLYVSPENTKIKSILTPTSFDYYYLDDNEEDDGRGGNGFISNAVFRGDHQGDDIGSYTGGKLTFDNIRITLMTEKDDCIPKELYATLVSEKNQANVSPAVMQILKEVNPSALPAKK